MHPILDKAASRAASFWLSVCILLPGLAGCTVINARPGDATQKIRHTTRVNAQIEFGSELVEERRFPPASPSDRPAHQGREFATKESPAIVFRNSDATQQLGRGPYVVQIAAYQSEQRARATWSDLERRTPSLFKDVMRIVERADVASIGTVYRLRAGYFSDAAEANAFCILLDLAGTECMVLRTVSPGRSAAPH
jgi:cell division septation protein DedD